MAYYQSYSNTAHIRELYLKIFEEVLTYLQNTIDLQLGLITTDVIFVDIPDELL